MTHRNLGGTRSFSTPCQSAQESVIALRDSILDWAAVADTIKKGFKVRCTTMCTLMLTSVQHAPLMEGSVSIDSIGVRMPTACLCRGCRTLRSMGSSTRGRFPARCTVARASSTGWPFGPRAPVSGTCGGRCGLLLSSAASRRCSSGSPQVATTAVSRACASVGSGSSRQQEALLLRIVVLQGGLPVMGRLADWCVRWVFVLYQVADKPSREARTAAAELTASHFKGRRYNPFRIKTDERSAAQVSTSYPLSVCSSVMSQVARALVRHTAACELDVGAQHASSRSSSLDRYHSLSAPWCCSKSSTWRKSPMCRTPSTPPFSC